MTKTKRTKRCADPGKPVTRQLYGLATGCAAPGCNEPLIKVVDGRRTLNSRIAHIRASGPNGPRADPYMTCEEVNDFDNLVVLCLFHAIEVDEHVDEHPIEMLEAWKKQQHADAQVLGTTIELTEAELTEAVQAVSQSNVSTATLVELAKAVRAMRTATERNRRNAATVWAQRNAAVAQLESSMAGRMFDSETGEAIDTSGARLSKNEEQQYRNALIEALNQAQTELEPAGERVLENAAGVAAAINCPDGLEAWLDRAVQELLEAATSWDPATNDPDSDVRAALDELDQVATTFQRAAAGAAVDIPAPPEPPAESEPSALDLFIADYKQLYDDGLRFTRVDHLPYDDTIHAALVDACPTVLGAPDSPHFMTQALTASQNAMLASAVCRNATDDEFNDCIVPRLLAARPEAVAAVHIGYLRQGCEGGGHDGRVSKLDDMMGEVGQEVLGNVEEPAFWVRNQWYSRQAISAAVIGVGEAATATAISAAIAGECLEGILLAFAPVVDSMDSDTMQWKQTQRSYRRSGMSMFPDWFPTTELVDAIRAHEESLSNDEIRTLAQQLLADHPADCG